MPPKSKGRPATYSSMSLKQEWKDYKTQNPKGTKREFAQTVGLSYSRIKAILNDHPSEHKRVTKRAESSHPAEEGKPEPKKKIGSGMIFFSEWDM